MQSARIVSLFFYALVLACGLSAIAVPLADPDTLWHIAAGDLIRETGSIPKTDSWSFTAAQERWLNMAWLFDIGVSHLYESFGFAGLSKMTITLMALHSTLMFYAAWRYSGNLIASLFVATISVWCLFPSMLARPQWVTCISVLLFVLILRFKPAKAWFLLPAIMVVWANIHGGFFIGFAIIGAYGIEALLKRDRDAVIRLTLNGIICALATLVTPLGWHLPEAIMRTMNATIEPYIVEWQPPKLSGNPIMTFYVVLFIGLSGMRSKSIPLAERILALASLLYALSSVRMLQVAASLSIPYLAMALSRALTNSRYGAAIERKNLEYSSDFGGARARYFGMALACLATLFLWSPLPQQFVPEKSLQPPADIMPKAEVEFILKHYPTLKFFNNYDFGGYIVFSTRGKLPVFIDGRARTAFSNELTVDYINVMYPKPGTPEYTPPGIEEIFTKYNIGGVLSHRGDMFGRMLAMNPLWKKVYEGEAASVYVRAALVKN